VRIRTLLIWANFKEEDVRSIMLFISLEANSEEISSSYESISFEKHLKHLLPPAQHFMAQFNPFHVLKGRVLRFKSNAASVFNGRKLILNLRKSEDANYDDSSNPKFFTMLRGKLLHFYHFF
jgi:hypothetical protein